SCSPTASFSPATRPHGEVSRCCAVARANHRFIKARPASVIIVIIGCSQSAVLRVDDEFAGLAILRTDSLYVLPLADDLHIRPAVGLQLLTHLVLCYRLITRNERGSLTRSRV